MKPQYEPKSLDQKLGYLVEECGEVLAAVGKTQRWGLDSVNPELPPEQQETNRDWILRELYDLRRAIYTLEAAIIPHKDIVKYAYMDFDEWNSWVAQHVCDEYTSDDWSEVDLNLKTRLYGIVSQWHGQIRSFAQAILHGDETHQQWLLRAAEEFCKGQVLPKTERTPVGGE